MKNFRCRNCGESGVALTFGWCEDCWRAALKGAASCAGAALVTWLVKRFL